MSVSAGIRTDTIGILTQNGLNPSLEKMLSSVHFSVRFGRYPYPGIPFLGPVTCELRAGICTLCPTFFDQANMHSLAGEPNSSHGRSEGGLKIVGRKRPEESKYQMVSCPPST